MEFYVDPFLDSTWTECCLDNNWCVLLLLYEYFKKRRKERARAFAELIKLQFGRICESFLVFSFVFIGTTNLEPRFDFKNAVC